VREENERAGKDAREANRGTTSRRECGGRDLGFIRVDRFLIILGVEKLHFSLCDTIPSC
jgi:hypothetical protein